MQKWIVSFLVVKTVSFLSLLFSLDVMGGGELSLQEIHDSISKEDWELAEKLLNEADSNSSKVQLYWGMYYGDRDNSGFDLELSRKSLEKSALNNNVEAQLLLVGHYLLSNDNPKRMNVSRGIYWAEKLVPWLQENAKKDNINAIRNLALFYMLGIAKEKNLDYAFTLFKFAADNGDEYSIKKVSYMYRYGLGVKVNESQANHYSSLLKGVQ